ncbi:ATP-binding cassette domain-containing protein [Brevibacterium oceani]|uniref:ATP-binding cassette domain-containing protein n=1 Tax=Brevibacterium oceani TaxID=358099 RepID=UPI0015E79AA1|nr:ABC transporter ATP-binding protein [Brevibacterium oceani]
MSAPGHPQQGSAHPHSGEKAPLHPDIKDATPRWMLWTSVVIAWASAAATALVFVRVGALLDGRPLTPATSISLVLLIAVAVACAWGGVVFSDWASSTTERRLRSLVISRVFDLGAVATNRRSSSLISLATDAVDRTAHYRAGFLGPIVGALTTPLLVLGIMALTTSAEVAGWVALLVLLVPVFIGGFRRLIRPVGAAYRRSRGQLTSSFLDAITALEDIVYARVGRRIGDDLARRGEAHRRNLMRLLAGNQLLILVVDAAFSLTVIVAAAALTVARVSDGSLSLGEGMTILLMTTLVIGPVDIVGQFFYIGVSGRAAQQRISGHLGDHSASTEVPATTAPSGETATDHLSDGNHRDPAGTDADHSTEPRPPALELRSVTAGWPGAEPVFVNLDLRIERGERVAIVGPSGVGKSTLSALIQAHLTPQTGQVIVDGIPTSSGSGSADTLTEAASQVDTHDPAEREPCEHLPTEAAVRSHLGVVEQRTFLFMGTIADNLRLALPADDHAADDSLLWEALDFAGLRTDVEAMPDGLATEVGDHGRLLSGGQAQRLAIARAWLRDAPILLFDEPTSQVDLAGEAAILEALGRLGAERTVIMIAHRPEAILAADRVIDLSELRANSSNGAETSSDAQSSSSALVRGESQ